MTLKELSQLYYLNREIEMDKRRLQELEVKALPGAQVITGMPHAPGVTDKVGCLLYTSTGKTSREEVGTAPSLRWMENPRHCGPGILEAKVKELTICKDAITIVIQPKDYNTKI